ncbi:hypothetical protein PGT21_024089 [Puccinia graminis f. sp. tritici]|uniref:Uncharacterized protein n=1 Tax=Puccinia graminis f. sp. tritici TaxID=56615 RepID=A0A5B0LMK5_PUCGR|nr:hypothetical protein PGT21_024089 [Puccinia graminis f. sp. tritici]
MSGRLDYPDWSTHRLPPTLRCIVTNLVGSPLDLQHGSMRQLLLSFSSSILGLLSLSFSICCCRSVSCCCRLASRVVDPFVCKVATAGQPTDEPAAGADTIALPLREAFDCLSDEAPEPVAEAIQCA